jgi:hypothetical protein
MSVSLRVESESLIEQSVKDHHADDWLALINFNSLIIYKNMAVCVYNTKCVKIEYQTIKSH